MSLEGRDAKVIKSNRRFDFAEEDMPQAVGMWYQQFKSLANMLVREIEDGEPLIKALDCLADARDAAIEGASGNTLFVNSVEGRRYNGDEDSPVDEEDKVTTDNDGLVDTWKDEDANTDKVKEDRDSDLELPEIPEQRPVNHDANDRPA